MTIVPETRARKITFYQTHVPVWAQDPASIGLTTAAVDQLQALVEEARQAMVAQQEAQLAARNATQKFHNAVRRMHVGGDGVIGGATMLQLIKVYAQTTGDDSVYSRAHIAPPAKPGRPGSAPVPGTPYDFKSNLSQIGEIELTWKCDNPDGTVGTIYQIKRKTDGGPLVLVGTVGEKKFLDDTIPPGTKECIYEVTAMRSTGKGNVGGYIIQFGCAHPNPSFVIKRTKLVA